MKKFLLGLMLLTGFELWALQLGKTPPEVSLDGKDGGKVDGGKWDSSMLVDKVHVLFYVDPDKKDVNNAFSEALKQKGFSHDKYRSVAIVNMAATWMPNFAIESKLKEKQKKYPNALYVKDKKKILVEKWGLADNASNIVVFGKNAKVLYFKNGKLNQAEIVKVLRLIEDNL